MTTPATLNNNTTNIANIVNYNNNNDNKLERKITIATEGIPDFTVNKLRRLEKIGVGTRTTKTKITSAAFSSSSAGTVGRQNIETICNYFISYNSEVNVFID
jgi:hypothetical protein